MPSKRIICKICKRLRVTYAGRVCKKCRNRIVVEKRRMLSEDKRDKLRAAEAALHRVRYHSDPIWRERIKTRNRASAKLHGRRRRLAQYGLTLESFESMFVGQGRRCAICLSEKAGGKGWCVDHCHTKGHVRGILCTSCNRGIGNLGDSAENCRRAAEYLESSPHVTEFE